MIFIFQLEISRLMCICWLMFFDRYTSFCVSYIIVISERIRQLPFKMSQISPSDASALNIQSYETLYIYVKFDVCVRYKRFCGYCVDLPTLCILRTLPSVYCIPRGCHPHYFRSGHSDKHILFKLTFHNCKLSQQTTVLISGCPGIRESRHLPAGPTAIRRRQGTR